MRTNTCIICGNDFEAVSLNSKYCSDTCRKIGKARISKRYNDKHRKTAAYYINRETYRKNTYHYAVKYCKSCGKKLNDGRQTWCLDCLLDDYVNTKSRIALIRLTNRGYNKARILELLRNRR